MPPLSLSTLESVFNHAVLPPKLPGSQDARLHDINQSLILRLIDASTTIRDLPRDESFADTFKIGEALDKIKRVLEGANVLNAGGKQTKNVLLEYFRGLRILDLLILHVTEQNAGLLITRHFK